MGELGDTEIIGPRCVPVDTVADGSKERFCVDAKVTAIGNGLVPNLSNKFIYEDMNASTGGVARSTAIGSTATNLYSYSGTGVLLGIRVNVQTLTDWIFNIEVDGTDIMGDMLMSDMLGTALYGFGDLDPKWAGLRRSGNILEFTSPSDFPISFSSSVTVKGRVPGGSKNFLAGLVALEKIT